MTNEPTNSERDALALIAGIERASRRSRPFFLFGLLAVILGFVSVSVYLYQDREEERAQKAVLEKQVGELSRTLNRAKFELSRLDADPQARRRLRILLGEASETAGSLPAAVAEAGTEPAMPASTRPQAATPPPTARTPPPPSRVETAAAAPKIEARGRGNLEGPSDGVRFTIHVSEPSQLPQARGFAQQLPFVFGGTGMRFIGAVVAPVEQGSPPGDNSLRCYDFYACDFAEMVAGRVHRVLAAPRLQVRWMDGAPPRSTGVRDYHIWFAPGPVRLAPLGG